MYGINFFIREMRVSFFIDKNTGEFYHFRKFKITNDLDDFERDLIDDFGKDSIFELAKEMRVGEYRQLSKLVSLTRFQ